MRRVEALAARFEGWVFAPGDPRQVAALRIGLGAILAVRLATGSYVELARQPAALFRPISFLRLLEAMPPPGLVAVVQAVALVAAVLAVAGVAARITLPLAWAAAVPLIAMTSSLGKTAHNDVLLLLCLVPLLPAPTADAWSLAARRQAQARAWRHGGPAPAREPGPAASWRYGWPVRTAMVVVAGAYFFSGLAKLLHAGPAWVTSGNLRWALYASSDAQPQPNPAALLVADRPWLAHLLAAATIAVELGFPLVLWRPRLAFVFVPAVVAFHAGTWAAMRLDYWPMAATVLIVMMDWPALADRLARAKSSGRARPGAPPEAHAPAGDGAPPGERPAPTAAER
jgi:hypothetical protein